MTPFRQFLAAIRCAQTALALSWCEADARRTSRRLEAAYRAHRQAVADFRIITHEDPAPPVPLFLKESRNAKE